MNLRVVLLCSYLCVPPYPTHAQSAAPETTCADWQTCRDRAEQARAAGDYEAFHDLAWRAVQTRGRRDPDLFFLLARAQSLSGRPLDALVTLQRLAQEMHVASDVSQDEDFRRVRALPGWPDVQAIIAAVSGREVPAEGSVAGTPKRNPSAAAAGETKPASPPAAPPAETSARKDVTATSWTEVARFAATSFVAGGLAYDAVSRRFVIGNLPARKLTIVEEGTNRAATLSGDAAQLLNVRAIEIDRSQGDLWVVSEGTRNGEGPATSELHKLQLVSGRVLTVYTADATDTPARFVDVAVAKGNGAVVLDASGPRLLRPGRNGKATLVDVMALPAGTVTSLAPADDGRTVYVAYADHVARVDLGTRHVDRVSGEARDLADLSRLRWHKGSLVGAQVSDGKQRILHLRLNRAGNRVLSARTLDDARAPASAVAALDLLEDDFFYLVPGEPQASIRRIRLK